jgi:hypothetical protein
VDGSPKDNPVQSYDQIAEHFGVTLDRVRQWQERNAPIRPPGPFDLGEIASWLDENGHIGNDVSPTTSQGQATFPDVSANYAGAVANGTREVAVVPVGATSEQPKRIPTVSHGDFSDRVLNMGFLFGLALAGLALLLAGGYLISFLVSTNSSLERLIQSASESTVSEPTLRVSITARMILVKMVLLSCGIFVGLAFGFLGFSLFLIGIKGEMHVEAQAESYRVRMMRMYPGVFIILCATVLVAICVLSKIDFSFGLSGRDDSPGSEEAVESKETKAVEDAINAANQRRNESVLDALRKNEKPKVGG